MEQPNATPSPKTHFAPAGRVSGSELDAEVASCLDNPIARVVLESVESYALVLNEERQILAANETLFQALSLEDPACFEGMRPGEILGCVHAAEGPDGCGTSRACGRCGAVLTILAAQSRGQVAEGECLLSTRHGKLWEALEFHVRATPLQIAGHTFLVLVMRDISAQKRREVFEQVFLHDLMNTLQGLRGWTELLQMAPQDPTLAARQIATLSDRLTEEVLTQRLLVQAERGDLSAAHREIRLAELFEELKGTVHNHQCSVGRLLEMPEAAQDTIVNSDPRLLQRILLNMVINALEATPPEGCVRLETHQENGGRRFTVHNPGFIPESVANRIFLRSFSTKGTQGRGLGTYSMKLLGENVLGGEVGFTSTPEDGTQFFLLLPEA